MNLLTLLFENPIVALIIFAALVVAIGVHEFAHAYAANKLGDPTPRLQGRLTLNPIKHLDPVGTLLIIVAGIGWGKPVEFNPHYLKKPRTDAAIVAVAGPISNILMASLSAILLYILPASALAFGVNVILMYFITLNIALAVFNLIPIEPLDGFKILSGVLPPHLSYLLQETRKYGIFVLLILFITGSIDRIVFPLVDIIVKLLIGGLI